MYDVYFDKTLLPISPERITLTGSGKDQVIELINFSEVDFEREPGLDEISFDIRLTNQQLPMSAGRYISPQEFMEFLEKLYKKRTVFQYIVIRKDARGNSLGDTNISVRLADRPIKEDANDGSDFVISVTLREHKKRSVKTAKISGSSAIVTKSSSSNRWETTGVPRTYTVKRGDTLCNIGQTHYNNSYAWQYILEYNNMGKTDRDKIKEGQVLKLPEYVSGKLW